MRPSIRGISDEASLIAPRVHDRRGKRDRDVHVWIRRKREHDFASQGAQQTDLREGGREDVEIGGEDGAMVLADDAHLATRASSIAHEGPHDLVGAGETDWMDAEGTVIVTRCEGDLWSTSSGCLCP